ncbi:MULTISPECIES: DUF5753 domain-containing protein [Actinoalloteichus]|nr:MULTISPECIES: DUF5753 domain-containing protein [Actinoalloteichus]
MARDVDRENWAAVGSSVAPTQLDTLVKYENEAQTITDVNPLLVPGLLQTRDYAYAIMRFGDTPETVATKAVLHRLGRQSALSGPTAPKFTAILAESALIQRIGSRMIMADQLDHVVDRAKSSNISVRVLPIAAGYHAALMGGWFLLEFDDAPPVVHLEHVDSGTFAHTRRTTRSFLEAKDSLLSVAMSAEDSVRLIATHAAHHRQGDDLYDRTSRTSTVA